MWLEFNTELLASSRTRNWPIPVTPQLSDGGLKNSVPPRKRFAMLTFPAKDTLQISQVQVRTEVHNWQKLAKNGDEGTECREKILGLLSKFREAQRQQDLLIEKEKLRLDAFRNCINEDTTNRIKKRLTFFQKLNKQHEALLEHVRQDIQDCRMICKKFNDSSGK